MRASGLVFYCWVGVFACVAAPALATEQIYRPVSPTFGGNPLNGNFLLSTAQTQGAGTKSGAQQAPDLSGLNSALSNIGNTGNSQPPIVVIGNGTSGIPTNP
jgi:curli production assembly/transport component CsgF